MMVDASALARELKFGGTVGRQDLAEVIQRLRSSAIDEDAHNLLRVVGLACMPNEENVALVARFLEDDVDDYARQGAIYALCEYWNLASDHFKRLLELSSPSKWVTASASSMAALNAIGRALFNSPQQETFRTLLDWLEGEISSSRVEERSVYIESLHKAIDVAMHGPDASKSYIRKRYPRDIDQRLLLEARDFSRLNNRSAKMRSGRGKVIRAN